MEESDDKDALFKALSLERSDTKEIDEICVQKSPNVLTSIDNQNASKNKTYQCKKCPETFLEKSAFLSHMKIHREVKTHQCSYCDKVFSRKSNLKRHIVSHTEGKRYECTKCNKTYSRKDELAYHLRTHTGDKPHKCNQCEKAFAKKSELLRHMNIHTRKEVDLCSQCGKTFSNKRNLKRHMITHTEGKPHLCTQCGKTFSNQIYLKRHMKTHLGEKLYKCNLCDKTFTSNNTLIYHMETHSEEKTYECGECNRNFPGKAHLSIHMKKHTGEKLFQCSMCGKTYLSNYNLKCHMRIHTGEELYQCKHCNKKFINISKLTNHTKIHGEKPYQCTLCSKAFLVEKNLNRHINSHNGKKRKCIYPNCEEGFHFQKDLIEHLKLMHNVETKVTQLNFSTWQEFLSWKENEEKHNLTYYSKQTATKILKNGSSYSYFHCQKDGDARPHRRKGEEQWKSKRRNKKGVVKKGMTCPSKMICKVDTEGAVRVKYIQSHFHPLQPEDTEHHPIQKKTLDQIREMLISGASVGHIYNELQEGINILDTHKRSVTKHYIYQMKYKLIKKGMITSDDASTVSKGKKKNKNRKKKKSETQDPVNNEDELTSNGSVVLNVDRNLMQVYKINGSVSIDNNPSNFYQTGPVQERDCTNTTTVTQNSSNHNYTNNNYHTFYQSYQDHINETSVFGDHCDSDSSNNDASSLCETQILEKKDQGNTTTLYQDKDKPSSSNNNSLSFNEAELTKENNGDVGISTNNGCLTLYHTDIVNDTNVEKDKNTLSEQERALIALDKISTLLKNENVRRNGMERICHLLEEVSSKCNEWKSLDDGNNQ